MLKNVFVSAITAPVIATPVVAPAPLQPRPATTGTDLLLLQPRLLASFDKELSFGTSSHQVQHQEVIKKSNIFTESPHQETDESNVSKELALLPFTALAIGRDDTEPKRKMSIVQRNEHDQEKYSSDNEVNREDSL